jgi:hypothetical protein
MSRVNLDAAQQRIDQERDTQRDRGSKGFGHSFCPPRANLGAADHRFG